MKLAHLLTGLLLLPSTLLAQRTEDEQLLPPDLPRGGHALYAVGDAVVGDGVWTVVSGVMAADWGPGQQESVAFVYRDVGGEHELFQTIRGLGDPGYGYSLALDGDTLVLGSFRWGWPRKAMGRVLIFGWDGASWTWTQTIRADGLANSHNPGFGRSVAVSGDVLVVGAPSVDHPVANMGQARIYLRSSSGVWELAQRLTGRPWPEAYRDESWAFGYDVAVDGDTVVISAAGVNETVLVYERSGDRWVQTERIEPPGGHAGNDFGRAIALSADTLVVGEAATGESRKGRAHVYTRAGSRAWALEQTLWPSDGFVNIDYGDAFGYSVDVEGNLIAVGALNGRPHGWDTGEGYLFRKTSAGWPLNEDEKLAASDPPDWDELGCSVSIGGGKVVFGARHGISGGGFATGKAYVFSREAGER